VEHEEQNIYSSLWIDIDDSAEKEKAPKVNKGRPLTTYQELGQEGYKFVKAHELSERYTQEQIERLEKLMRPKGSSTSGFIGEEGKILEVAEQNKIEMEETGISFEELAARLKIIRDNPLSLSPILKDKQVLVEFEEWWGGQCCPFCQLDHDWYDDEFMGADFEVTHKQTGQSVGFSDLTPHLIGDHHFLQGAVPYHFVPKDFVEITREVDFSKLVPKE